MRGKKKDAEIVSLRKERRKKLLFIDLGDPFTLHSRDSGPEREKKRRKSECRLFIHHAQVENTFFASDYEEE